LLAEWVWTEIEIRSPCKITVPCDIEVDYDYRGLFLIVAGGILMLCNVVIYPAKAALQ
jgi:hypothetical protein